MCEYRKDDIDQSFIVKYCMIYLAISINLIDIFRLCNKHKRMDMKNKLYETSMWKYQNDGGVVDQPIVKVLSKYN